MAKEPMHTKMYRHSPTLETAEDGHKYIKKNLPVETEQPATAESVSVDARRQELLQRHVNERMEMFQRQERDYLDLGFKPAVTDTTP